MSKMDALRAMREARYEEMTKRAKGAPSPAKVAPARVAPELPKVTSAEVAATDEVDTGLCGHRNMGGRTCTREHGHAAKSHRYS